ncbi:hypothetical protein R1sor_003484 [Riccia sorocarpa]|uniref:Transcription termination factor MTERF9, chloroplastic n=1 Tax=Riccia sorocarpa TaxID=122646 RepID=A0ABD3H4P5_9MARC
MLTRPPLQLELQSRGLHAPVASTSAASQVSEVKILLCRRGCCLRYGGEVQVLMRRVNLGYIRVEEAKAAAAASWANKNYKNNNNSCCWRGKRSCPSRRHTILLSQKIRGTARDSGLLLEPVSYIGSQSDPAVETKSKALSPAGVDEEERFLNALVAKARIRETSHRNGCTAQEGKRSRKGEEENSAGEKEADEFQKSIEEGAYERIQTKSRNQGKQAWRLYVEGFRTEDERQVPSVESASGNARELEEAILFLESIGVDATKLLVYPFVVNCSLQKSKTIIRVLQSAGLKVSDLGRILTMSPQIFTLSVENDLRPKIRFLLKEVGLSNQDLRKVIRRCPRLLVVGIDEQLRPTMQFLRNIGFTGMASVVSNNPTLLAFSVRKKLIPKLEFLESLGLSYEDACTMVVRFPAIFNYGIEQNLRPKYEYLVKVMGRSLDDLVVFPQYFGYSLDYRIRPRYEFLAERNLSLSLPNLLKLSNEEFSQRFKDVQVKAGKKELKLAAVAESQVPPDRRREIPVMFYANLVRIIFWGVV